MTTLTELMHQLDEIMLEASLVLVSTLPDIDKLIQITTLSEKHKSLSKQLRRQMNSENAG